MKLMEKRMIAIMIIMRMRINAQEFHGNAAGPDDVDGDYCCYDDDDDDDDNDEFDARKFLDDPAELDDIDVDRSDGEFVFRSSMVMVEDLMMLMIMNRILIA